ncbi:MAG: SDR family oxidoreductase [Candidatus Latescibacteria bacterium]|nr:SDR family oxidoreductase [Candidatus Latescibacterota bacterium]
MTKQQRSSSESRQKIAEQERDSNLKPKRALITGGASGFGLSTAKALLAQGAQVAIADIDGAKLQTAADQLDSNRVLPIALDVTSPTSVSQAVATCQEHFGGLDSLVNSAGVIHFGPLEETSEADWDRVIDIDLKGVFLCCQAAAPLLRQSGQRGRIVNIGSDVSKIGCALIASYCAAKFGVVGLTKALAGELAPAGVTVNCVCPVGVSTTGMGQDVLSYKQQTTGAAQAAILAATAADIPLGRNPTQDDIVNAILFFLAEESSFLTGVALDVDGGLLSTSTLPGAVQGE